MPLEIDTHEFDKTQKRPPPLVAGRYKSHHVVILTARLSHGTHEKYDHDVLSTCRGTMPIRSPPP
jgi:hypothetical protein